MVFRVVNDERRDEARLQRDFATRKTLAATASKPPVRIVALVGPCAAGCLLESEGRDSEITEASSVCQNVCPSSSSLPKYSAPPSSVAIVPNCSAVWYLRAQMPLRSGVSS